MKTNRILPSIGLFATIALVGLLFASCQRSPDATTQWRVANEKAFNEYADSSDYKKVSVDGSTAFIYMKTIKKGEGKVFPIETSRVLVHYEVFFVTGNKNFIEGNFDSEAPQRFGLSRGTGSLIAGMRIALQNMVVGDEVMAIIPWHLGYGAIRSGSLEGYTTLRYHIKLDGIVPEDEP